MIFSLIYAPRKSLGALFFLFFILSNMAYIEELKSLLRDVKKHSFRIIIDNLFFVIEGYISILEYDDKNLKFKCKDCICHVYGNNFKICQSSKTELIVKGEVEKYEKTEN